jgi:hypothetical protein
VYWEVANRKQYLGHILYGKVEASNGTDFVLIEATQHKHMIKKPAGSPEVPTGTEVMVLMSPANEPISVYRLAKVPH